MIENKLSFAFSFSLAAGACVRVCLVRPPHAHSLRRWPQLSTLVRDHRGKSLCFREVGCLGAQIQPKLSLGGAGPWRFGWRLSFSNAERGTLAGLGGNVSVGRSAPQVASHSLTYCLVSKNGSFPAEGCFQPRVVSGQGLFPARGCFQPGVVSSQGLFPARGL